MISCKKILAFVLTLAMSLSGTIVNFSENVYAAGTETVTITEAAGWLESAYAEWVPVNGATKYEAYVRKASETSYSKLDDELIRKYPNYWRVDAVGLAAGDYVIKVEAITSDGSVSAETETLNVLPHDRSGFAFWTESPLKTSSGAYNDDGTLKSNAQVIYITSDTAKTCTATVGGQVYTGFQNILDAKSNRNTSDDVLDFRIIGCVRFEELDKISSTTEGLQIKGPSAYTNMNITIEGIGEDASVYGFGFLIKNCGNVELRNFGILNFMKDAVSIDTNNCNLWVHNLDIYYGQGQAKGDASVDIYKSQYCTVSYNHFWDSGKSCLIDTKTVTSGASNYLTYHHNWFDHSDSCHSRVSNGQNFHIYNNYYDGNAKYGVGVTTKSSAFVEANYFRNCNYPMMSSQQGTDALGESIFPNESGGIIKAFNNYIVGANSYLPYSDSNTAEFDAYETTSKNDEVPDSVQTKAGSTYSNFDTSNNMYSYTADSPEEAKTKTVAYAGRMNGGDLKWTFTEADDTSDAVIEGLKSAVASYNSAIVSIGGDVVLTGIALDVTSKTLVKGGTVLLTVSPVPSEASLSGTTAWTSDNEAVAKVSDSGLVTAVSEGTAQITAENSGFIAKCTITVSQININGIVLSADSVIITAGAKEKLTAAVTPADATEKYSITWESSNTSAATVDSSGTITGVAEGTATVTANVTGETGSVYTADCAVTVEKASDNTGNSEEVNGFVKRLYTLALGRESEADEEVASWAERLLSGESNGVDAGYGFVFSEEVKEKNLSDSEFVEMLYMTFNGRASDEDGRNAWVSQLEAGVTREKVFEGFVMSDEFRGICEDCGIEVGKPEDVDAFAEALALYRNQNADLTKFVARWYTKALGRSFDEEGLEAWCRAIITGENSPRDAAAYGFFFSDEFRAKDLTDEEYVQILYSTFCGRNADEQGLEAWCAVLADGEEGRDDIIDGFANSDEFRAILAEFKLD